MATTPYPFVASTVLTALQLNSTYNIPTTTKTASHTLIAADAGTRVYMNSASATTITVNTSIFSASDVVEIFNIGAGVTTLTAGTATVSSAGPLAIPQYGSGRLTFTAAGASIYTPSAVTAAAGALTLISATTIGTTVASVTVSSAFSATYENYRIIISGGAGSATATLALQIGSATSSYYAALTATTYAGASNLQGLSNGASFTLAGSVTTSNISMSADVFTPFLPKATSVAGQVIYQQTNTSGGIYAGWLNDPNSFTSFIITPSTGTLTGGTIRLYGYALT